MSRTCKSCLVLLALFAMVVSCQKDDIIECDVFIDGSWQYREISKAAEFLDGGEEGLAMALLEEITYPPDARENSVEGTVRLAYEISIFGTVEHITIVEDIGSGCGEEAQRAFGVASEGVAFSPAELDGLVVRVRKELPVHFKLE